MTGPLAVLIVEDSESDAQLVIRLLKKAGHEVIYKQVETREQLSAALEEQIWDVVISDYSLPQFDGCAALKLLKETGKDIPFIVVSGAIGEESAVALMKDGAHDYLKKGGLARLALVVERELEQANERREHKLAEQALLESEERWRRAIVDSPIPIMIHDEDGQVLQLSAGWTKYSGYVLEDIPTLADWTERAYGERMGSKKKYIDELFSIDKTVSNGEWIVSAKDGSKRIWDFQTTPLKKIIGGKRALHSMAIDITERKQSEDALRESKERFESIIEASGVGTWDWNVQTGETIFNQRWAEMVGYTLEELSPVSIQTWLDLAHPDDAQQSDLLLEKHFKGELENYEFEGRMKHKNGHWIWILDRGKVLARTADGKPLRMLGTHTDITARKQAEEALRLSEQDLKEAQAVAHIGNWKWNLGTREVIWSDGMYRIFGIDQNSYTGRLGDVIAKVIHPEDLHVVLPSNAHTFVEKNPVEYRIILPDKSIRHIWAKSGDAILDDQGNPLMLTGIAQDITERKLAENQLAQLSRAVEQSPVSIVIAGIDGRIEYVNPKFTALNGYSLDEVRGQTPSILKSGKTPPETYTELWQTILAGEEWHGVFLNRKRSGELYWENIVISPITDSQGTITHFVAVGEDISARKEAEEKIHELNIELEQLAITDYLTNLYNRRFFMQRGDEEFKRAQRNQQPLSLLMLDIDEFKNVNDTFGHETGDLVLKQVSATLKASLREIDILGRIGGEEFAILLPNTTLEEATILAERVRQTLEKSLFETPGQDLSVTICIGVSMLKDGMSSIDSLMRNADAALYHAKHGGRNRVVTYV